MWKLTNDLFLFEIDFSTWPLNTNETLTNTNNNGSLVVTVLDDNGNDVTASAVVNSPTVSSDGNKVQILLSNGLSKGFYKIHVIAPTTDDELLSETVDLHVK